MAGGKGTRLWPVTQGLNKHFLPIYDKPMIFYSLSTMMLAGVREILLISDPESISQYKTLLSDGSKWGIKIDHVIQSVPDGIPSGLILAEEYIGENNVMYMLGDNLLIGNFAGRYFQKFSKQNGAMIFTKEVNNPGSFGVVNYSDQNEILTLEEKPSNPRSNHAITGIYFFDSTAPNRAKNLKKSARNEFEMVDLLIDYHLTGDLFAKNLPIGTVWLDTGTVEGISEASEYVRIVQNRQSILISSPEIIALTNSWISPSEFQLLVSEMPNSHYKEVIKRVSFANMNQFGIEFNG
jgi:glucose-1-phosphate thymidylyltransferase